MLCYHYIVNKDVYRQGNKRVGVISATFEVYLRFKHHLSFSIMIVFYQSLFYIIVFYYFIIVSCFYLSLASWLLFSDKSSVQFRIVKYSTVQYNTIQCNAI